MCFCPESFPLQMNISLNPTVAILKSELSEDP
jgi:hypothetical protein